MMIDKILKYPIGVQSFEKIREEGYVYVDKTRYVHRLAEMGGYIFLSRPRRFGKSLFLSTVEAYFRGRRDLFEGLEIEKLTSDWTKHDVIHFDLNPDTYDSEGSLDNMLDMLLGDYERKYGIEIKPNYTFSYRLSSIIKTACEASGRKVVVLIDEYDKPLLNAIKDVDLLKRFRTILKAFYGTLKSCDQYVKFAMLTGVARFSKVSIFSDLNNLHDISFESEFAGICGITQEEIEAYFGEGIERLAEAQGVTVDDSLKKLKYYYDGYHFTKSLLDVYNPYSLINTLSACDFENYWFRTGTPTYLVRLLEKGLWNLDDIPGYSIDADELSSAGIMTDDPIPALYQSGYLTIKDYDSLFNSYTLDYPNKEVKDSFMRFLVQYYIAPRGVTSDFDIRKFVQEILTGEIEAFMTRLSSIVAQIPYGRSDRYPPEEHFRNAIYILFNLMGIYTIVEDMTSRGGIDLTVETQKYVYIFEFKVNKNAEAGMSQIKEKHYWKKFECKDKKIILVAANFSSKCREIDDILIERL